MGRPQDKHLIPLNQRTPEERRAIQSKGGKISAERKKQAKAAAELMQQFCDLPISDGRVANRLKRLGITDAEDLTNKMLMVVSVGRAAQMGNVLAFEKVLELLGESGMAAHGKENNLLEALKECAKQEVNTDDISELQQTAESDADVVAEDEV